MVPNGSQETPVVQGLRQCKQHVASLDSSLQAVTVLADASSPLEVRGEDREMEREVHGLVWQSVTETASWHHWLAHCHTGLPCRRSSSKPQGMFWESKTQSTAAPGTTLR